MKKSKIDDRLLYIIFSSIATFIYFLCVVDVSQAHKTSNIILYAGSIGVFMSVYFLPALICRNLVLSDKIDKLVSTALMGGAIVWLIKAYSAELSDVNEQVVTGYLRHNMPLGIYVCILILAFIIGTIIIKNDIMHSVLLRVTVGSSYVIVATILLYAPNIMADSFGGIDHANAYCTSIINVLYGMPYEVYSASIYGHYGLVYFLPVSVLRLFGMNQWIAITT